MEQPLWLWAALVGAIGSTLVAWAWFRAMHAVRRWVSVALRAALLGVLALLLAGLVSSTRTSALTLAVIVDRSGSVSRGASAVERDREQSASGEPAPEPWTLSTLQQRVQSEVVRATMRRGKEDLLTIISLDASPGMLAAPSARANATWDAQSASPDGTDIAGALRIARAAAAGGQECQGSALRCVLISDGNAVPGGDEGVLSAARELASAGVKVDVVPLSYTLDGEVMVEEVDAPPSAPAEATVNVRVLLHATGPSRGTLLLSREGEPVDVNGAAPGVGRRIVLAPGRHVEVIEVPLPPGRVHRFRATYEPDVPDQRGEAAPRGTGDISIENNSGEAFTIAPGATNVLLIDGAHAAAVAGTVGASGGPLAGALRHAGIETTALPAEAAPLDALSLQAFDMVLLVNVAASDVSPQQQDALASYIRDSGGGLVMVGGPNSFAPGGWRGSRVAELLPVLLDIPDQIVAPQTATVMVLDSSGSMERPVMGGRKTQQQIADESAALAVGALGSSDLVGVIEFNSAASVVVPLAPNKDPKATQERIGTITPGGGTNIAQGLELAIKEFERLRDQRIEVPSKHVVLLTDGKSQREGDLPGLVDKLRAMGVQVSTIAVGDDADNAMLDRLAHQGGGAFHHAANPRSLPKIFLRAIRVVKSPLIKEGAFEPVTLASGSPVTGGLGPAPALQGFVLTRARPANPATLAMVAPAGEPVLAHWPVGLGQVGAFTSDAETWAQDWLSWPGYERMWSQLVRTCARPRMDQHATATIEANADSLRIRLRASSTQGLPRTGGEASATIFAPSGESTRVSLAEVAPGEYEGTARASERGSHVGVVTLRERAEAIGGEKEAAPVASVIAGATVREGEEYRALASNDGLLKQVAAMTGGRVLSLAQLGSTNFFDRTGIRPAEVVRTRRDELLVLALVLLIADIACRRIAWDRWFSGASRGQAWGRVAESGVGTSAGELARKAASRTIGGGVVGDDGAHTRDAGDQEVTTRTMPRTAGKAPSLTLGEEDAAALAAAARDRRLAERLRRVGMQAGNTDAAQGERAADAPRGADGQGTGALTPGSPNEAKPGAAEQPQAETTTGADALRRAKRRAEERFDG